MKRVFLAILLALPAACAAPPATPSPPSKEIHPDATPSLQEVEALEMKGAYGEALEILRRGEEQRVEAALRVVFLLSLDARPARDLLLPRLRHDLPHPYFFSPLDDAGELPRRQEALRAAFETANDLLKAGDHPEAVELLELAQFLATGRDEALLERKTKARNHPLYAPLVTRLKARAALHAGDFEKLPELLKQVRERHPACWEADLSEAVSLLLQEKYGEARPFLESARTLRADHPDIAASGLFLADKTGRAKEVEQFLDTLPAKTARPFRFFSALLHLREGNLGGCEIERRRYAGETPPSPETIIGDAWLLFVEDRDDEALEQLDGVVRQDAANRGTALAVRGRIYFSRKEYESAAADFRGAARLLSDNPQLLYSLAVTLQNLGDGDALREAEGVLTKALRLGPANASFLIERARIRIDLGLNGDAEEDLRLARTFSPENLEADVLTASLLIRRKALDEAEALLNRVIGRDRKQARALLLRGMLRHLRKKYPQAVEDLEAAIRLQPEDVSAWEYLGHTQQAAGNLSEAMVAFDEAIRLDPDNAEYYRLRGLIRFSTQMEGAREDLEKAIGLDPKMEATLRPFLEQLKTRD